MSHVSTISYLHWRPIGCYQFERDLFFLRQRQIKYFAGYKSYSAGSKMISFKGK